MLETEKNASLIMEYGLSQMVMSFINLELDLIQQQTTVLRKFIKWD